MQPIVTATLVNQCDAIVIFMCASGGNYFRCVESGKAS